MEFGDSAQQIPNNNVSLWDKRIIAERCSSTKAVYHAANTYTVPVFRSV